MQIFSQNISLEWLQPEPDWCAQIFQTQRNWPCRCPQVYGSVEWDHHCQFCWWHGGWLYPWIKLGTCPPDLNIQEVINPFWCGSMWVMRFKLTKAVIVKDGNIGHILQWSYQLSHVRKNITRWHHLDQVFVLAIANILPLPDEITENQSPWTFSQLENLT